MNLGLLVDLVEPAGLPDLQVPLSDGEKARGCKHNPLLSAHSPFNSCRRQKLPEKALHRNARFRHFLSGARPRNPQVLSR